MVCRDSNSRRNPRNLASERGASMIELAFGVLIIATLSGIAIGVTPMIVRLAKGESGAQELDAFLKRHREMAIARRRDIEIRFIQPNQVESLERPVPDPDLEVQLDPTFLERMTFEGQIEFWMPPGVPDTPNGFGNGNAITVGGNLPVMFSSEGSFLDAGGNPVNATISLGVEGDPLTATSVTILGTTAAVQRWRWNGANWIR
jgi:hypothetical protein